MGYHFRPVQPQAQFVVTDGGAAVEPSFSCAHGDPALSFHLIQQLTPTSSPQDVQVLIPQCMAPQLFGAALACIRDHHGPAAADSFVREMLTAYEEATKTVLDTHAQQHPCCQAAYATGGREHTCRQTTR